MLALAHARHYPAISWLDSYSQYVDDLADWWRRLSPDWAARREEMVRLLSEEEKLQQIVRLVGPDVLPDAQRLILLVAEMFKNGFLRQNALDPIDTFCSPIKQVMLLTAFVTFYRRAQDIIRRGAPIARIREMEAVGELQRAASRIPNDDQDALRALLSRLDEQLGELEREYAP